MYIIKSTASHFLTISKHKFFGTIAKSDLLAAISEVPLKLAILEQQDFVSLFC